MELLPSSAKLYIAFTLNRNLIRRKRTDLWLRMYRTDRLFQKLVQNIRIGRNMNSNRHKIVRNSQNRSLNNCLLRMGLVFDENVHITFFQLKFFSWQYQYILKIRKKWFDFSSDTYQLYNGIFLVLAVSFCSEYLFTVMFIVSYWRPVRAKKHRMYPNVHTYISASLKRLT